jgi:DNA-binding IclR family transcriptional regulator
MFGHVVRGTAKRKTPLPMSVDDNKSRSAAPAVDRAIAMMGLLESRPQHAFALSEIARELGIPKSTASNICTAMVIGQLARKTQNGYQLGRRLVQLGSAYVSSIDIVREFYEVSRRTDSDLGAMIQLAVLDDEINAVYLARQDCLSGLRLGLRAEIGRRVPANCTAAGKALLAALPINDLERRLAAVYSLPTLTNKSIASIDKLMKELTAVRRQGYSGEDEEVLPGVCCVARATRTNHREDGLVAISITAIKDTLTPVRKKLIHKTLSSLIDELQQRL